MNVIDAKTMSADPVAVVELPNRVPYGFHAFFVNEVSSVDYFTSYISLSKTAEILWTTSSLGVLLKS